jgi:hypothetical protein
VPGTNLPHQWSGRALAPLPGGGTPLHLPRAALSRCVNPFETTSRAPRAQASSSFSREIKKKSVPPRACALTRPLDEGGARGPKAGLGRRGSFPYATHHPLAAEEGAKGASSARTRTHAPPRRLLRGGPLKGRGRRRGGGGGTGNARLRRGRSASPQPRSRRADERRPRVKRAEERERKRGRRKEGGGQGEAHWSTWGRLRRRSLAQLYHRRIGSSRKTIAHVLAPRPWRPSDWPFPFYMDGPERARARAASFLTSCTTIVLHSTNSNRFLFIVRWTQWDDCHTRANGVGQTVRSRRADRRGERDRERERSSAHRAQGHLKTNRGNPSFAEDEAAAQPRGGLRSIARGARPLPQRGARARTGPLMPICVAAWGGGQRIPRVRVRAGMRRLSSSQG